MMSAYAEGINRYIEICAQTPAGLPKEFLRLGFHPSRWTSEDVAQIFVGSMAARSRQ
jgi:acyl-homoserine lactone acylase PvdQ